MAIFSRKLKRLPKELDSVLARVTVHENDQTNIDVYEKAIFIPDRACLYDENGVRIDSGVLRHDKYNIDRQTGQASFWPPQAELQIKIPEIFEIYNEPVIYLSVLFPHWGHFATECSSRLWALEAFFDNSIKLTWARSHIRPIDNYILELFDILSIDKDRIIFFDKPVMLGRAFVPQPSCRLEGEYYNNHANVFKRAAYNFLGNNIPEPKNQPVYLSRSRFRVEDHNIAHNNRTFANERMLEELLKKYGFLVVYPECLNLYEKIVLFNTHLKFVGSRGSHFFAEFFSLRPRQQEFHVFFEEHEHEALRANIAADKFVAIKSYYIGLIFPFVGDLLDHPADGIGPDFQLDIPQALAWLSNAGVINAPELYVPGEIKGIISGRGEVKNEDGLSIGRRYSGHALEAIYIDIHSPAEIEYLVESYTEGTSNWISGGEWAGIEGHPIRGIAMRLKDTTDYLLSFICTFIGFNELILSDGDCICKCPIDSPLEALQIVLTRRPQESSKLQAEDNCVDEVFASKPFGGGRSWLGSGGRLGVLAVGIEQVLDLVDAVVGKRHNRVIGE